MTHIAEQCRTNPDSNKLSRKELANKYTIVLTGKEWYVTKFLKDLNPFCKFTRTPLMPVRGSSTVNCTVVITQPFTEQTKLIQLIKDASKALKIEHSLDL